MSARRNAWQAVRPKSAASAKRGSTSPETAFEEVWPRKSSFPDCDFSPGITFNLPVNRPKRVLLVQIIGKHTGESLK